jgi:DNA polymerase
VHNLLRDCIGSDDHTETVFIERYGRKPGPDDDLHALSDQIVRDAISDALIGDPDYLRMMYGPVLPFISKMMRRTLCAPVGSTFIQGDYSAIEARMMSWLCQDTRMLATYASGGDPYRVIAGGMIGKAPEHITKEERQRGKVSLLAMGFQGGVGALVAMGMQYGMRMSREEARPIVRVFRDSNPELMAFGRDIFNTAVIAVQNPHQTFGVAPLNVVSFFYDGQCLHMNLPSGRQIRYWAPRIEGKDDYGNEILTCLTIKGQAVFRRNLWPGIFCENAASGASVDLLAGALTKLEQSLIPVVLHVHDGIEAEVREEEAAQMLPVFRHAMLDAPGWTKAGTPLPINASIHVSPRFG